MSLSELRPEFQQMRETLLKVVFGMLKKGSLPPFGMSVDRAGEPLMRLVDWSTTPMTAADVLERLTELFREDHARHDLTACAWVYDEAQIYAGAHRAVAIRMEHFDGEAISITMPYAKRFLRGHKFGEPQYQSCECSVFIAV